MTAFRFRSAAAFCFAAVTASAAPSWQEQVLPIFREHCNGCHNPDKLKADLDLTSYAGTMKGGSSGECVKPGNPDGSLLFRVT
ncbi:MAG: c-type cytochrome domain-containing protein, partial [Verrucomicrobiota bacterium]